MKASAMPLLLRLLIVFSVFAGSTGLASAQGLKAIIVTDKGTIEADLNERAAPTTVASFVNLAQRGFYDGLTFHRVERNFVVQGGDPLGTGTGGPGYRFMGEIVGTTVVGHHAAIIPTITGRAWITGQSTLMLDPDDPYPAGYRISDTWPQDADA